MTRTKKAMAAQYTEITLDEMKSYLTRAFRALRPQQGVEKGETVFDLFLDDHKRIGIRVWSSIAGGSSHGAGVGADAIRVQFYNFGRNRPLKPGKAPIVKRTQNWRDSLKDRIEDYIELFDEYEDDLVAGRFINWK